MGAQPPAPLVACRRVHPMCAPPQASLPYKPRLCRSPCPLQAYGHGNGWQQAQPPRQAYPPRQGLEALGGSASLPTRQQPAGSPAPEASLPPHRGGRGGRQAAAHRQPPSPFSLNIYINPNTNQGRWIFNQAPLREFFPMMGAKNWERFPI